MILRKREKRGFAGKWNWSGPIRRQPDKARAGEVERENRVTIRAV